MKNAPRLFLILFLCLCVAEAAKAQLSLRGTLIDGSARMPLVGATVLEKGTSNGTVTDGDGNFVLNVSTTLPLTLEFRYIGYQTREVSVDDNLLSFIELMPVSSLLGETVVTGSRMSESMLKSPVAIEKLDIIAIKSSPASSFFDAIESMKGVSMTTLSLGFKVPNTRGFGSTTNARFLQMTDGVDTQAPGLGVSIANTVGPTELDIQSVEILPGAGSALYGMNALNGISNMITKSPFTYQGVSFYTKTGVNHVGSDVFEPQVFTESALRYARAFNEQFAFKINIGYLRGTDWIADDHRELNPDANVSVGLTGADNPGSDPLNSYGNENQNRQTLTLADGKRYQVRRTGYYERDLVTNDYTVENMKADATLMYNIDTHNRLSYTYRAGKADAIYQRGNRIRLDNYLIQQHKAELTGKLYRITGYWTIEETHDTYNLRPMGENLDRNFKSDPLWFAEYASYFNESYAAGMGVNQSHHLARERADEGRYKPGTALFDAKIRELAHINNSDVGAQMIMQNQLYHFEGQYDLSNYTRYFDLLVGADWRDFLIMPEGNSFTNPDPENPYKTLHNYNLGGFVQATKALLHDKLKLVASVRLDKNQYFQPKWNPRFAWVYSANEYHHIRMSYQNGFRFPTLFEGFSTFNNGGVLRMGGMDIMSKHLGLFENSWLRSSVDAFQKAFTADVNSGMSEREAVTKNQALLIRNTYTYLQPERINAVDAGYKGFWFNNLLYVDVEMYFNVYDHFIDQIEIAVPDSGSIGQLTDEGVNIAVNQMIENSDHSRYRMWTNSKSVYHNYGASLALTYTFPRNYMLSANYTYSRLAKIDKRDAGLETPFNTPPSPAEPFIWEPQTHRPARIQCKLEVAGCL